MFHYLRQYTSNLDFNSSICLCVISIAFSVSSIIFTLLKTIIYCNIFIAIIFNWIIICSISIIFTLHYLVTITITLIYSKVFCCGIKVFDTTAVKFFIKKLTKLFKQFIDLIF